MTARSPRSARVLAVLGTAAATLVVWAIAAVLLDVRLDVRMKPGAALQHVGPATVVLASLVAGFAAWALLALLERLTPRARRVWTVIAVAVLALSLIAPLQSGVTTGVKVTLLCMHLVAGAVLVPALARTAVRR
ncbi:DUF6069 family protein [Streptomyces kronopolitis]|uniref:DUF6069 family protein n=1 Tax=Streptomyces kronopolitis TaxID=1612435 RepID=UPI0020BD5A69|nr:DUF6069 family protein [Streptomyces kronopolitis]MCL6302953.1 DUF6069 family protein [Streptomyces kronopolitis]